MRTQTTEFGRLHLVRLDPDEDLLRGIEAAVQELGIQTGLIVSGIGSLKRYHYHVVETTRLPPGNVFPKGEGAYDLLHVTGVIADGRVHAHLTFSDREKAMGGHLEEGCQVLTFAVVALVEAPGLQIADWDRVYHLP